MKSDIYGFKLLVEPAEDVRGAWVAHVLDIGVVTYGFSFREAFDLGLDAARVIVADDLEHGRDPMQRDRAPVEVYRRVGRIFENPAPPLPLEELERQADRGELVAALFLIQVVAYSNAPKPARDRLRIVGQPAPMDLSAA